MSTKTFSISFAPWFFFFAPLRETPWHKKTPHQRGLNAF
jgi:hypothetical protein